MKKCFTTTLFALMIMSQTFAQVYSNKVVGAKNEELIDSLKTKPYPYALPIWGAKVTAKGFDLPYSAGISANLFVQKSDLIISDLYVGFNNGPMYDLDEIVRFNNSVASAAVLSIRPDVWVLPFLNVYAILGKSNTSTEINAGVWIPDQTNTWNEVTSFSTKAEFTSTSFGFGMTPTIGVAGGFLALDMNTAWTDVSALDKPVFTFVFGPRFGKTFKFKKERSLAVWAGGFRVQFSSETSGSIALSEIIDTDGLQTKVDDGLTKVADTQVAVDEWWAGLTPVEQKNPGNIAKHETADRVLQTTGNLLTSMDGALNDDQSATVQYSLQKDLKDKWNFVIGSQYQFSKHFMVRAEYGFLGSRQQFMTGLQYRFGL